MYVFRSESNLVESKLMGHVVFELGLILFTFFEDHDTALFVHLFGGTFGMFRFFEELLGFGIEFGDGLGKFTGFIL